ncbi:NADH-quinone oxidoreductase subunit B [Candidatus Korarchaeum cryptofilum]|jgi:NADH-quinone oxidoreductase subunit B|uniref:F420H2 dehydrogenase subunit n=2 Tax=Candidatus Korarchaeum cryptofilum TaxID=498846 RepID=B1L7S0_KORCO|nr:NADH-quinone oxidoreductase subunit NuoB [Candidatus Korarchaeum cryptofilum]ACB06897.1 F420H2 dehydrogenase subunit [Candidatus Korarchaeum cryptofilum OPF8]RSN69313.1 NADH-quinone oxidoreductase subunit B [Candidatus Korarchaeum cryptofilum]
MVCALEGSILIGNLERSARKAAAWLVNKRPIRDIRDWGIAFSLWPVHFTTACCGAEFAASAAPKYDAERLGFLPFIGIRQCNVLFIEGTLSKKMAEAAIWVYEQMPEPKFVIGMGACAIDGGIFWNSYNIVRPMDILPVNVFIPGCPPRPEAVAQAIIMLQRKIRKGELVKYED